MTDTQAVSSDIDPQWLKNVKGFLHEEEGRCLFEAARDVGGRHPCLEVGSYCGLSTLYLAAGCKAVGGILFAVDHHRGSEENQPGEEYFDPELVDSRTGVINTFPFFRRTLQSAGMEETVVPIVSPSAVAARMWRTPLGLVFIDGSHAFASVEADYLNWSPFIVSGGYLLMHDIFPNPADGGQDPYRVYQQALSSGRFEELRMVRSLGVLRVVKAVDCVD